MTKNLVIVESPTKSKTIEKFLGRKYTVRASACFSVPAPEACADAHCEYSQRPCCALCSHQK